MFNVQYAPELRLVYGLLEMMLSLPLSIGRSSIPSEFMRALQGSCAHKCKSRFVVAVTGVVTLSALVQL